MSYLEQVCNIVEDKSKYKWDYYGCHQNKTLLDIFDNPKCFISDTFMFANKKVLLPSKSRNNSSLNITEARAAHSISSFFLGIFLANGLLDDFNAFIKSNHNSGTSYPFSYVWNLTCLYHDYGYKLENDKELYQKVSKRINLARDNHYIHSVMDRYPYYYGIYSFRQARKIRGSIWKNLRHPEYCCKTIKDDESCEECQAIKEIESFYVQEIKKLCANGINVTIPNRRSKDISRYFAYRLLHNGHGGCIDHGIAGGMVFFDSIIKNYAKAYVLKKQYNQDTNIMEFMSPNGFDHNLRFSFDQLKIFAYIADCIINHNVWKAEEGNIGIYQEFCLDKLIRDKFEKINFYKNPLLFILVISDTLEPYKNFNELSIDERKYNKTEPIQVFNKFKIVVENRKIIVQVPDELKQQFRDRIYGMEDWIDIQCKEQDNIFVIILNKVNTVS